MRPNQQRRMITILLLYGLVEPSRLAGSPGSPSLTKLPRKLWRKVREGVARAATFKLLPQNAENISVTLISGSLLASLMLRLLHPSSMYGDGASSFPQLLAGRTKSYQAVLSCSVWRVEDDRRVVKCFLVSRFSIL